MADTDEGRLVLAARAGDQRAFGQLFDAWFDRVHDLSRRIVRDTEVAGEVAQDAFLKAWTKLDTLDDPDAFGGWLLRIARNASLNRLEKERRSVAIDDESMTALRDLDPSDDDAFDRMDQAARIALVWDAAQALGPRDASVLDLHLRHGLGPAELADELGVTPNNAKQVLFTLRKRLGNAVRALVLWRAGHPTCGDLRQGLSAAGLTSFGAPMVKAIDRHVDACATCSEDRIERLSPAALFAAAPIVAAPIFLKAEAAAALAGAGVPMSGSSALQGPGAPGADAVATDGVDGTRGRSWRRAALMAAAFVVVAGLAIGVVLASQTAEEASRVDTAAGPEPTAGVDPVGDEPPAARPVTLPGTESTTSLPPDATTSSAPTATSTPAATTAPPATATTAPIGPPTIDQFDATPTATLCGNEVIWSLTWATTDADAVTVGRTDGKGQPGPPDGKTTICAPFDMVFFLNADGPGGVASATAGGPAQAPTTIVP